MQMMKIISMLVMLALIPEWSYSAATVYTDRASFEAAIGPNVTYTFDADDGFPAAPANISSFADFEAWSSSSPSPAALRVYPDGTENQTLSGQYNSDTTAELVVSFLGPQYALGFDDFIGGSAGAISIQFGDTQTGYLLPGEGSAPSAFFGLISTDPILGFSVESQGDFKSQRYKGIDNLTIVPEPAGICLLLPTVLRLYGREG